MIAVASDLLMFINFFLFYLFIKIQKFCLKWSRCGLGDCERVGQTSRVESFIYSFISMLVTL